MRTSGAPGPSAASRFALAYERLAFEDAARHEWLERASRRPDPDERDAVPVCEVCFGEVPKPPQGPRAAVCPECKSKGYIGERCECGEPLTRVDRKNPVGDLRKRCVKCREAMTGGASGNGRKGRAA